MNSRRAVDAIHQSTKHGTPPAEPDRLVRYQRLDPRNRPTPFKRYLGPPISPLPRTVVPSSIPAGRVLSGELGDPSKLDADLLATLLFLSAGVTRTFGSSYFRTAMSAGNLHPVEIYVVAGPDIEGVTAGVHHFAPLDFGLTELRNGDFRQSIWASTPMALVLTGVVWRTTWKYGERGWRHLYWDAGTMLANLLAAADAHGLEAKVWTGFEDAVVSRLVGIDGKDEVPLAIITLGSDASADGRSEAIEMPELRWEVVPVAPHPVQLPLLVEAQEGSALASDQVEDWWQAARSIGSEASGEIHPPDSVAGDPIEKVIVRRGSTRVMIRESIAQEAMLWPMAASTRAVPMDAAPGGALLVHYLAVHGVDGLQPGAYQWLGGDLQQIQSDDSQRSASTRLCLDQALGGDSAYTVFHQADLDSILDALGSRGYRAAQLEAGIVSGRLALCAFALGLGATGLTFFDDSVSQHFRTKTAPMLVTAVGPSVTRPAPAGTPGEPITLSRR